jgi:hypothetical protein
MRQADFEEILAKVSETYPHVRWMGSILDDGYDGISLCGVLDGLSACETALGDTGRTPMEAAASVKEQLRELWS